MIEPETEEELQEKPHPCPGEQSHSPNWRIRMQLLLKLLYQKLWIRIIYTIVILGVSLANVVLSWFIYRDALLQLPGLVFDETSEAVLVSLLVFNVAEIIFFIIDILVWTNMLWNEPDCWFIIDVANLLNILLSELPLSLINTYLSACHEAAISESMLIKSSLSLVFVLFRFVALTVFYLMNSTDDGFVATTEDTKSRPGATASVGEEKEHATSTPRAQNVTTFCCDVVRAKRLRRFWLVVRIFILFGFFLMLITNILLFKFSFIQTYKGYLEWRRIAPAQHDTLQHIMAERYFHDVEIFLKETELSTRKWLHLVSLEKIMHLQSQGAKEQITLNYIQSRDKIYCIFSQLITFSNRTTETSMTCWLMLGSNSFRESACEDLFDAGANRPQFVRLKSLKILFTYRPPDRRRHLGVLYYNATRINVNGTTFTNVPLKMEYFQNTIAHHVTRPNSRDGESAVHNHDGWNSGPFRPADVYLPDRDSYIKYDPDTGDLIPVSQLWRTGFAMCPSTAPNGPMRMVPELP